MDDAGHLIPREKIMGRNKAIKRLYEKMKEIAVEPQNQVFISHGDCMEDVEKLEKLIMIIWGSMILPLIMSAMLSVRIQDRCLSFILLEIIDK